MKTKKEMVFVGLNGQVVALDRDSGRVRWKWQSPKGGGYMTLLPDRDRLVVSAGGYIYCLDPATGKQIWNNPLTGFGCGVASLTTLHKRTPDSDIGAAAQAAEAQQAAATAVVVT
jgi:outer membrane protein assembly factor BamB